MSKDYPFKLLRLIKFSKMIKPYDIFLSKIIFCDSNISFNLTTKFLENPRILFNKTLQTVFLQIREL